MLLLSKVLTIILKRYGCSIYSSKSENSACFSVRWGYISVPRSRRVRIPLCHGLRKFLLQNFSKFWSLESRT